jgi:hypothetical protein
MAMARKASEYVGQRFHTADLLMIVGRRAEGKNDGPGSH